MEKHVKREELIRQLIDSLCRPMNLESDVLHYIDSTLGPASAEEFKALLTASEEPEAEAVLELLFFPGQGLQEAIEPLLAGTRWDEGDADALTRSLCEKKLTARICFPGERGEAHIPIPDSEVAKFVARLNLCRFIDPELARAICDSVSDPVIAARLRVRIRNSGIEQSGRQTDFLSELIRRNPKSPAEPARVGGLMETIDFAIYLLEQTEPEANLYEALMAQKRLLVRALYTAEKSRERLSSNTVEALIMQGISIPSICPEAVGRQIGIIDRISLLLYGKTEHYPHPSAAGQSLTMDAEEAEADNIGAMRRFLSY